MTAGVVQDTFDKYLEDRR